MFLFYIQWEKFFYVAFFSNLKHLFIYLFLEIVHNLQYRIFKLLTFLWTQTFGAYCISVGVFVEFNKSLRMEIEITFVVQYHVFKPFTHAHSSVLLKWCGIGTIRIYLIEPFMMLVIVTQYLWPTYENQPDLMIPWNHRRSSVSETRR